MPAHIAHLIFAQKVIREALGEEGLGLISRYPFVVALGAQGPDTFLHNQRTRPLGLGFGTRLHARGYGSFVRELVRSASPYGLDSPEAAFILAWTSHAFLDRAAHPFIIYFSGWVDHRDPETSKYLGCHVFFERILDVLCLERFGQGLHPVASPGISDFDFFSRIDCGPVLPPDLLKLLASALTATNRGVTMLEERIGNAYLDAMSLYRFTNPVAGGNLEASLPKATTDRERRRLIALFHPRELPSGIDFLNEGKRPWRNPCSDGDEVGTSFPELWEEATDRAVTALRVVASCLRGGDGLDGIVPAVGDGNLSDGKAEGPCLPRFVEPLPLSGLMDRIALAGC
jgi:hypothetical protein